MPWKYVHSSVSQLNENFKYTLELWHLSADLIAHFSTVWWPGLTQRLPKSTATWAEWRQLHLCTPLSGISEWLHCNALQLFSTLMPCPLLKTKELNVLLSANRYWDFPLKLVSRSYQKSNTRNKTDTQVLSLTEAETQNQKSQVFFHENLIIMNYSVLLNVDYNHKPSTVTLQKT